MCVGIKVEDPLLKENQPAFENQDNSQCGAIKHKRRNNEERKEKAKDAARNRRTEESDYFEQLEKLLPLTGPPPSSQQTTLDKTSVIRLSVAHLKTQDVLKNGIQMPLVKEEMFPEMDLFSCLDGFSLVLGSDGNVIYVSENVSKYIGLTQVELLGQEFADYVHPCDHSHLKLLTPDKTLGSEDEPFEIFVRVKCTVTERGRMINLKQANYKPLKISGKARCMPENEVGGVAGTVFLGLARSVVEREVIVNHQIGVFTTKHSVDMKFIENNHWISTEAGYNSSKLIGVSFFELVHAQDIGNVQKAFKNLKDHGQCETSPYRLLCCGGGYAWVQTKACVATTRRGCFKGQTISCSHQQISEVMNRDEILSIIQMKKPTFAAPSIIQVSEGLEKCIFKQPNSLNTNKDEVVEAPDSIQFEIIEDPMCSIEINVPSIQKSVIIQPRQIHDNDHPIFKVDTDKKISAAPTSVIVKCRQPEMEFVSVPLMQKPIEAFEDKEGQNLKTATECIWKKSDTVTNATQSICDTKETAYDSLAPIEVLETLFPVRNTQEEDQFEIKETDFFDDLFSNLGDLEKFAPHSGYQCIPISKTDHEAQHPAIEADSFDDMIVLNFCDNVELSNEFGEFLGGKQNKSTFMNPNEKPTFDENQVLIDPNRNAMWGSGCQDQPWNMNPETFDIPWTRGGMPVGVGTIWTEEGKGDNFGFATKRKFEITHNGSGMRQAFMKQKFIKNPVDDYCFEPPGDKIVVPPKVEKCYPRKRNLFSDDVEHYSLSKRFKFGPNEQNISSVINHVGYANMDHQFDNNISDIEVVTIN